MRKYASFLTAVSTLLVAGQVVAQPPGVTMEMINRQLPLEGAPLAIPGQYTVTQEAAFGDAGFIVYRPIELDRFPESDNLPLLVWGNGGCAIDGRRYGDFLSTIASHGFIVMTTIPEKPAEGEEARRQANSGDMTEAIEWAEAENQREGSHLKGKIDTGKIALMGQSCGGFMSAGAGTDPRVSTIGMFNSGLQAPNPNSPAGPFATTEVFHDLHGPVLLINGGEVDFMYETAQANFDAINDRPVFYGARDNAGHTATVFHPGGGEYANVASNWLKYHFKDDQDAGRMFTGKNCGLCTNPNWETDAKGMN
jgi:dienelactone hydrolase